MTGWLRVLAAAVVLAVAQQGRADALDDYARARMEQLRFPGLAVAVLRNGEPVAVRTWGTADVRKGTRVAADTVFELGSLSKQFTAAAVMMLVEEKRIRLDESIARYLPEVPRVWAGITVRHLLTHTSGIRDYLADPDLASRVHAAATHDDVVALLLESPIEFSAAETWAYSNSGYLLLGSIIERTSGLPYGAFLEHRIFAPLGMRNSAVSDGSVRAKRAVGYGLERGTLVPRDPVAANAFAAGGIVSTITDMVRWAAALDSGKLLTPQSRDEIWTPAALRGGGPPPVSYGFGWVVDRHRGEKVVLHGGGTPGFSSAIRRHLGTRTTVVLLTNRGDRMTDHLAMEIAGLMVPALARTSRSDPEPQRSSMLRATVVDLLRGRVDAERFTRPMRVFLGTANGRGMAEWIGSHGATTSWAYVEGERDGELRVLRYRATLGGNAYSFTVTLTPAGEIAQFSWW